MNGGMGKAILMALREGTCPLGARIILIADTIDAMTTDRPYRKRLPLDVVIGELQKCKGTQFDPELVDVVVVSVAVRRLIAGTAVDQESGVSRPDLSASAGPRAQSGRGTHNHSYEKFSIPIRLNWSETADGRSLRYFNTSSTPTRAFPPSLCLSQTCARATSALSIASKAREILQQFS